MEAKCLMTKLQGIVNDNTLLRLGELVIEASVIPDDVYAVDAACSIDITNKEDYTIRIVGDGYVNTSRDLLVSNPLKEIKGSANIKTKYYFTNGNYKVYISNKYSIGLLIMSGYSDYNKEGLFGVNVEDLNFTEFAELRATITFGKGKMIGSISNWKNKSFNVLQFSMTDVTGDITNFTAKDCTVNGSRIYGDFTNIVKLATIQQQIFRGSTRNVRRDGICSVDLSQASNVYEWLDASGLQQGEILCKWTTTRPSSYKVIAIKSNQNTKFAFGNYLDSMLINQANCQAVSGVSGDKATIDVTGNRTTASDSAVATLKSKGYTVVVNGVTL